MSGIEKEKRDSDVEAGDDSPEDYFHHTRKLKALRMN